MNKKQKELYINIILLIIIAVLIIFNLLLFFKIINKNNNNKQSQEENTEEIQVGENQEETTQDETEEKEVSEMNERDRITYYINEFLDLIGDENYEKAYGMLNQEFKNNYFKTQEEFKEYAEKKLKIIGMEFKNIERLGNPINGNLYVMWFDIQNIFEKYQEEIDKVEKEEIKFVILEKDYDDFEISFNVKE